MKRMRSLAASLAGLLIAVVLTLAPPLAAQEDDPGPPPAWMVEGVLAAAADPAARDGVMRVQGVDWLLPVLPPGDRRDALVAAALAGLVDVTPGAERSRLPWLLTRLPPDAITQDVVDALLARLDPAVEPDGAVRNNVAVVLAHLPERYATAALALTVLTRIGVEPHSNPRNALARLFESLPTTGWTPAVRAALLERLAQARERDAFHEVRRATLSALGRLPPELLSAEVAAVVARDLAPDGPFYRSAGWALRQMPEEIALAAVSPEFVGRLVAGLAPAHDASSSARANAARVLSQIPGGRITQQVVAALLARLDPAAEPDYIMRMASLQALANHATHPLVAVHAPRLAAAADPAREPDNRVRREALQALRSFGTSPLPPRDIAQLSARLDPEAEPDAFVRSEAARTLAMRSAGEVSRPVVERLLRSLEPRHEPDSRVRSSAAYSVARLPATVIDPGAIETLIRSLDETHEPDGGVRRGAAWSLRELMPDDPSPLVIDTLRGRLDPAREPDAGTRSQAAQALLRLPGRALTPPLLDLLLRRLDPAFEPSGDARVRTAWALAPLNDSRVQAALTEAFVAARTRGAAWGPGILRNAEPLRPRHLLTLLDHALRERQHDMPMWRALAHILTGGDPHSEPTLLLRWLGQPATRPLDALAGDPAQAHRVLTVLLRHWDAMPAGPLHEEAERVVALIAERACALPDGTREPGAVLSGALRWLARLPLDGPVRRCWNDDQAITIAALRDQLAGRSPAGARMLADQLARDAAAPFWQGVTWAAGGWIVFWGAFVVAFPWSRTVQAAFLFSPVVRRYLSLGVVPLLLLVVPPLRRRLLAPFRDDLLAEAKLDDLAALGFFGQGQARRGTAPPQPVQEMLGSLDGVVVLRGEAGLGKTSALRWLAASTRGPVAFLHARDCHAGVAAAVAALMKGVQETDFVRGMVHAGTLGVIIDGLNEVSAATRERVRSFAAANRKGRIVIGTQPIEWTPPAGAAVIDLLPLARDEAEAFLLSRPVGADASQRVHGAAYQDAVRAFLRRALDEAPTEPEREAAALVLSNPFDLAFAADLIAQGAAPSATGLIDEAFRLADEGPGNDSYRAKAGRPFPLVPFGRHAVAMREEDRNWLGAGAFEAERPCLLERKLLVRRAVRRAADDTEDREMFRHDRVWDFFIAAAFRADAALLDAHLDDPRFRGAYLRIAETWPPEAAKAVRDLLVVNAARTNDNTTSNEFVRRLQARLTA
ncbi:hypothetical protein [Elioraea sp.]|uniref:HEAT repeat domain-containing protein n=1 Tax=Elioraea sp. TaxID=2185103 RepID=UPI003F6E8A67